MQSKLGFQQVNLCAPKFRPAPGNRPPSSFEISDTLKGMLISSVACGSGTIAAMVAANYTMIECLSRLDACSTPDILMIRLQVGLTDFALDAARGQIDNVKVRGQGSGETHFRGTSYRDAEASKQSQGTSTFRSRANSANNFARTSESHESSFSNSRSQADGEFTNTGFDRSRTQQNAMTDSFDKAIVEGRGTGAGQSSYVSTRTSSAESKTDPNPNFTPIAPNAIDVTETFGIGQITAPRYDPIFSDLPVKPICAPSVTPDGEPVSICDNLRPSVGAGFRSSFSMNGSLTVGIGPVSLSITASKHLERSDHWRIQHVCSAGNGRVNAVSSSSITYQQDDAMTSSGNTKTEAAGFNQHDIGRRGDSLRTSTAALHAESSGRMDSCGESHSNSQRQAHGEAQNTGQSFSRMERHSESDIKFQSISKTITEARYFNQIFRQLLELRKLLWERLVFLEARTRASKGSSFSCAGQRTLTAPPLFWFANAFTCMRCLKGNCHCGA